MSSPLRAQEMQVTLQEAIQETLMWDQTVTCKTVNEISLAISRKFKGGPVRQNIIVKLLR